jgi:hypothetical protein
MSSRHKPEPRAAKVATGMRGRLDATEVARFNDFFYEPTYEPSAAEPEREIDVSPVGLVVAVAGAVALLISVFLPFMESTTFPRVAQNTLIQSGDGWILIVLSVAELFALYRIYVSKQRNLGPGTNKGNFRLCPVGSNPLGVACETAKPGIGIYVAGVGGLLMIGGWQLYRASPRRVPIEAEPAEPADSKTCPDCAESVKSAARVCRLCGYQLEGRPDVAAPA